MWGRKLTRQLGIWGRSPLQRESANHRGAVCGNDHQQNDPINLKLVELHWKIAVFLSCSTAAYEFLSGSIFL